MTRCIVPHVENFCSKEKFIGGVLHKRHVLVSPTTPKALTRQSKLSLRTSMPTSNSPCAKANCSTSSATEEGISEISEISDPSNTMAVPKSRNANFQAHSSEDPQEAAPCIPIVAMPPFYRGVVCAHCHGARAPCHTQVVELPWQGRVGAKPSVEHLTAKQWLQQFAGTASNASSRACMYGIGRIRLR